MKLSVGKLAKTMVLQEMQAALAYTLIVALTAAQQNILLAMRYLGVLPATAHAVALMIYKCKTKNVKSS